MNNKTIVIKNTTDFLTHIYNIIVANDDLKTLYNNMLKDYEDLQTTGMEGYTYNQLLASYQALLTKYGNQITNLESEIEILKNAYYAYSGVYNGEQN